LGQISILIGLFDCLPGSEQRFVGLRVNFPRWEEWFVSRLIVGQKNVFTTEIQESDRE
jgi:hypothetical protein